MAVKIEEFVAYLGWEVDSSKLKEFNSQVSGVFDIFKKAALAIAGATAALTAFAVATNKQTSINARLAESIDMSAESLENWTYLLGAIDFSSDKVIRTVKTLNDRIGQAASGIGDAATVKESIKQLGLNFETLKQQKPEEQFRAILQGAKELENGQIAAAAATQLLGRQGSFLVGYLRDQKGSIEDLLVEQAKYNLLTDQNRESAKNFIGLWDNFNAVIDSTKAAFAAYLGDALSPLLESFLLFVRENQELIKLRIAEWAERVGRFLERVWRILSFTYGILSRVVDAFGGLENVLALVAGAITGLAISRMVRAFQTLVPLIMSAVKSYGLLNAVTAAGKIAGAIGLLVVAALAINSLIRFFQGKDSLVGDIGEKIAEQMDIGVRALAAFFGFSADEFNVWLVGFVDSVETAFSTAWDVTSGFFTELWNLDWQGVADRWLDVFSSFGRAIKQVFFDLVAWIVSYVPDTILNAFNNLVPKISSWVKKIPGVGDALGGALESLGGITETETAARQTAQQIGSLGVSQAPSSNVAAAASFNPIMRSMQTSIDNSRRSQRGPVTNTINVTQRAGEDSEAFGRRALAVIERAAATAMRDNDTGVVY